jgi:hypothetical protein
MKGGGRQPDRHGRTWLALGAPARRAGRAHTFVPALGALA